MSVTFKQKYFYWKKHKDFYDRAIIKSMLGLSKKCDGIDGVHLLFIYERLICESTSHDGELRMSDKVAFDRKLLNGVIGNINITKAEFDKCMDWLESMELLSVSEDNTIIIPYTKEVVKSETGESRWSKKSTKGVEKIDKGVEKIDSNGRKNRPELQLQKEQQLEQQIDKQPQLQKECGVGSGGGYEDNSIFSRLSSDELDNLKSNYEDYLTLILKVSQEAEIKQTPVKKPMQYVVGYAEKVGWPKCL